MTHNNHIFSTGWNEFDRLRREMNALFDYGASPVSHGIYDRSIAPPVNIYESAEAFYVQAELPGMKADEIDLSITGEVLTIKGERKAFTGSEGMKFFRSEIPNGAFQRTLPLPRVVEGSKIEAELKDGILRIVLPKKEEVKPRQIAVNKG